MDNNFFETEVGEASSEFTISYSEINLPEVSNAPETENIDSFTFSEISPETSDNAEYSSDFNESDYSFLDNLDTGSVTFSEAITPEAAEAPSEIEASPDAEQPDAEILDNGDVDAGDMGDMEDVAEVIEEVAAFV